MDQESARILASLNGYIRKSTSSPEEVDKSLRAAGIFDKNVRLSGRYRSRR